MHVLGKYECDERDVKRDERDERENFWLHISCFITFVRVAPFKVFGKNGLEAFVTEKLVFLIVVISSLIRISMFFLIIILQVSELIH